MKKILGLLLTIGLFGCNNLTDRDYNFSIDGTINGDYNGYAYLYKRDSGEWIKVDSVLVKDNSYRFEGNIDLPEMYYLELEEDYGSFPFFVEQSEITIKSDLSGIKNSEISGSSAHFQYQKYLDEIRAFDERLGNIWNDIKTARADADRKRESELEEEYDAVDEDMKQYILDYAKANNRSVVSAYVVLRNAYYYDETDLEPVVTEFDASIQSSEYVVKLQERVKTLKRVAIGQPAVDFTMEDMAGNPFTLSSMYGKYVLVDFWASWCGPCRRENPNVVAAYQQYNPKGFDILGVSFDKDKDKWMEAVEVDNLTWKHVSDLKGWGNEAGKLYAVNSIPANILLDPEGKIIDKNLRGEDLKDRLAELLD